MRDGAMNIMIGGEAGQGLVTVGEILAKSLVRAGYYIVVTQSYQSRIRGGHNTYTIRASADEISAPEESIDLLVALNRETVELHREDLSPGGRIIVGDDFGDDDQALIRVPLRELAEGRLMNVAYLGIAASLMGLDDGVAAGVVKDYFGKKDERVAKDNREVLEKSFSWASELDKSSRKLPEIKDAPARVMLNGNQAVALGAMSAGLKFCSFYPMTPSTSISLMLAAHAGRMGLVVEQAEDEIAAVNMAIGASFAGAPSMAATSGGGFALMVEGVSLAAMTETPLVIVIAQRPAPATGLPTRTAQEDLCFVLNAGHGEFPRALFAPGTIEECFYLTRRAFEVAHRYDSPVFVLTDQFLADSFRAVEPFRVDDLNSVLSIAAEASPSGAPYRRYPITGSGVSPRLVPGMSEHLVVADSDEHDEAGHITEDLSVRKAMVDKRLRKLGGIYDEVIPPVFEGDDKPDILLVCWGSTKGSALEAASILRAGGRRAGVLHFSQVWPVVPAQFLKHLERAGEAVCIEGNATGQLAALIRRESGFDIEGQLLRYDGLPITPEYIVRGLEG